MASHKKSWQEKMADKKGMPKVLILEENFPCYRPLAKMGVKVGDRVILTNPDDVEEVMKNIPQCKLITINEICRKLAGKFNVDACCTLTTGIFIMTAANAAEEAKQAGAINNNPYWRTLKSEGFLNDKYPGGQETQRRLLEEEGFKTIKRGKKYQVADYEKYLVEA
jgi:alkylated DNA nucleotide flippase Atl1